MMKLLKILALTGALALTACAGTPFGDALRVATSTVVNPVTPTNIYQVKQGYYTALTLADAYRSYCYPTNPFKSYSDLMKEAIAGPVCKNRRRIVAAIIVNEPKAFAAITKAEAFIAANPTINAASVIREAWGVVQKFQKAAGPGAAAVAAK